MKEKAVFLREWDGVVWSRAGPSSEKKPTAAMFARVLADRRHSSLGKRMRKKDALVKEVSGESGRRLDESQN